MRRFLCPVFAERNAVVLRVRSGGQDQTVLVQPEQVAYVGGDVTALVSVERTVERVVVEGASLDVTAPDRILVEDDLDEFTKRVLSAPHRAVFDAIVIGYCAWGLDVSLPVGGRFWAAAKGAPLSDAEVKRLRSLVKQEVDLVDPDRFASQREFRSLDAIDAALAGDGPRLVRKAVTASLDEPATKRWLSVVASALARFDANEVVDPVAIDVLACAFRPRGALEAEIVAARVEPAPRTGPPAKPAPARPSPAAAWTPPLRDCTTTFGGLPLRIAETAGGSGRFCVLLDGRRCRVRSRKQLFDIDTPQPGSHDWREGEDADLGILVDCVRSEHSRRTEKSGRVVFEEHHVGLSGFDADTKVVLTRVGADVIEIDIMYRVNELNPGVGW